VAWQLTRVLKRGGVVVWIVNDGTEDGSETGTSWEQAQHFKKIGLRIHDTMIWQKTGFSFPESNRYQPVFEYMFILSKGPPTTANMIKDRVNKWAGQKVHGTGREKDGTTRHHNAVRRGLDRRHDELGQRWNVWVVPNPGVPGNPHPATFPEDLARDHILSWSNEGDLVLDPFNGSGTTTKMARELGRRYIGIDVNQEYCEIAKERLAQQLLFGANQSAI
jgi:DNA modification methylase